MFSSCRQSEQSSSTPPARRDAPLQLGAGQGWAQTSHDQMQWEMHVPDSNWVRVIVPGDRWVFSKLSSDHLSFYSPDIYHRLERLKADCEHWGEVCRLTEVAKIALIFQLVTQCLRGIKVTFVCLLTVTVHTKTDLISDPICDKLKLSFTFSHVILQNYEMRLLGNVVLKTDWLNSGQLRTLCMN